MKIVCGPSDEGKPQFETNCDEVRCYPMLMAVDDNHTSKGFLKNLDAALFNIGGLNMQAVAPLLKKKAGNAGGATANSKIVQAGKVKR